MNNYSKYSKDVVDVRNFINKINDTAKILKEAYVYEDDMEMQGDEMPPMEDEQSQNDGREYVDAIRKSALQGIQIFAENVDNPSYEFFKKVFIMADKVLSEKENGDSE